MKKEQQKESELDSRINRAHLEGAWHIYTPARFRDYLLGIGLSVYEKQILPIEIEREYPAKETTQKAKIILFPDTSSIKPDGSQKRREGETP